MLNHFFETFQSIPEALRDHYRHVDFGSFKFWLTPLVSVVVFWVILVLVTTILNKRHAAAESAPDLRLNSSCNIWRGWVIAAGVTAFLLCVWIGVLAQQEASLRQSLELVSLLTLVIVLSLGIHGLMQLRARFRLTRLKDLSPQPRTPTEARAAEIGLRRMHKSTRLWMLLPLLGVLVYLLPITRKVLVGILLDNSSSMTPYVNQAKDIMHDTLPAFTEGSRFVITTFDGPGQKTALADIMKVTPGREGELAGKVESFNNATDALAYADSLPINDNSPVYEGIWKTYLTVKDIYGEFPVRLLIVITDGADSKALSNGTFFQNDPGFLEAFGTQGATFVDVRAEVDGVQTAAGGEFFKAAEDGGFAHVVASDPNDYQNLVTGLLQRYTRDEHLPLLAILIVVLFWLFAWLGTNPRKIPNL